MAIGLTTDGALGALANPYSLSDDTSSSGIPELAQSYISQIPQPQQAPAPQPSGKVWFSPTKREFFINGIIAAEDDDTTIEQAEALLDKPTVGAPKEGDWLPVDQQNFAQIADKIRRPSIGKLMAKNFGIGVDQLQQLGGYGLMLAGAEETGAGIVEQQERDLAKTSVYQREFTDIESAGEGFEWFVAALAQQGPNLLESIGVAALGAAAGTAAAGPLGGAAGTIAGFVGKKAFKDKVREAAKNYTEAKAKGVAPSAADIKTLKNAAAVSGAVAASVASNYAIGAADIYGEIREQGADADDVMARMTALAGAVPYAALESVSEYLLASRIFGGALQPKPLTAGASRTRQGVELLRRGGAGAGVGALSEGLTELGQEGLVMGLSGQDLTSDEAVKRFINSFAAGAAVGGAIGGVANLKRGKRVGETGAASAPETNLLDSSGTVTGTPLQTRGVQPRTVAGQPMAERGFVGDVAPGELGPQGVIDLGDMTVGDARLRSRTPTGAPLQLEGPPQAPPPVAPGQGALQFAPPAPEGIGFTEQQPVPNTVLAQQMQAAQRRQQEELAQQQRIEQQTAEREQQMNLLAQQAATARDRATYEAERAAREADVMGRRQARQAEPAAPAPVQPPMRPVPIRQPQQLPLFTPDEAPISSRAEGLRRGVGTQPVPLAPIEPEPTGAAPLQLPLISQAGQPMPATPAAAEAISAAQKRIALKRFVGRLDYDNGDVYEGQVKKGMPNGEGVYYSASGTVYVGNFKDGEYNGKGQYFYPDGSNYVGDFKNNMFNGQGVFTDVNGTIMDGQFEDDAFVPPEPPPVAKKPAAKKPAAKKPTVTKGETLKKGKKDAVQKPSTTQVPTRKQPEAGAAVGEGVPSKGEAPAKGEALKTKTKKRTEKKDDVTDEPFTPKTFAELEAEAAAQRQVRDTRAELEQELSVSELIDNEIETFETTSIPATFNDAIKTLVFHAYIDTNSNNAEANFKARRYLEDSDILEGADIDLVTRGQINDALVSAVNLKGKITLYRDKTGFAPVYTYLANSSLMPRLTATVEGLPVDDATRLVRDQSLKLTNLPDSTAKAIIKANPDLIAVDAQNVAKGRTETIADNDGTKLAAAIRALNTTTTRLNDSTRTQKIADIESMWDTLADEYRDFVDVAGVPLSSYFDGTKLRTAIINGRLRATVEALSTEQIAEIEADITQTAVSEREAELLRREESLREKFNPFGAADSYDDDASSGNYSRDDGSTITAPLSVGRIRLSVSKFINKLVNKPKVTIYKNQADLKAKNPRLHQRAAESRTQGDFDSVSAAGFSFGDGNVIIFSDRIATEQQLNFILAHETMGHFGLRGIIPANKFDALMNEIYRLSPAIRADVDAAMMANEGMGRAEAVEEYLSDFAGQVDTSIIARVWNAIKGALNKLGVQFGDEAARYFVSQARRYVRDGGAGMPFEVSSVIRRLQEIEYGMTPAGTGRFATVAGNVSTDTTAAALLLPNVGSLPMNVQEGWEYLKRQGVNNLSSYDKFKAKFLSLANFRARENPGSYAMEQLLEEMRNRSMSIKVEMNEKLREVLNKSIYGNIWGISPEQVNQLNEVLYEAQRYAVDNFDRSKEISRAPLYTMQDGVLIPNQLEIDRLNAAGRITFEQMRDGFSYENQVIKDDGTFDTETVTFDGIPDLTEDSIQWRGYNQLRDVMNDVELQLLRARYSSAISEQNIAFSELGEFTEAGKLSPADEAFIRRAVKKYKDLYTEGLSLDDRGYVTLDEKAMRRGNEFLEAFNAALIGKDTDRTATATAFFDGKVADDFGTYLNEFKTKLRLPEDNKFMVQNRVKELVLSEMTNTDADLFTRRSIATGYTPILREGAYQTRVEAVDPRTGKRLQLKESSRDQLVYSQFNSPAEAMEYTTMLNGVFGDKPYKLEVYDPNTGTYVIRDVKLQAVSETALDSVAAPPELNLNEFVRGLRQFDIALTPSKMETVVKALTRQNNAARNRLERAFVKGARRDGIVAIARHVEGRASTIAKTQLRPHMSELMNLGLSKTQRLWNGDSEVLSALKEKSDLVAADPNASPEAKAIALKEYQRYNFMYQTTNPGGGKPRRGMQYYNEASRTASFLEGNRNVDESDFGSGALVSSIRASTSMMQLGASVATGVLNVISAYTNGIPYLASYNEKNSFGGGFGMGPAMAEFHIALKQVGAIGMNPFSESGRAANRAEFYDSIAASPELQAQYNLKDHEARFIAREIREGAMIPAQSNALVGTARGRATTGVTQKFIDGWMLTFNLTEQASRRSLGLAAYRLEYQRQIKGGKSDVEAQATARSFAVNTLQLTLGEYSVLNRPPAWRSGIQSFIYMYKVFPTTSIQLLANLSRNGQIGMLTGLFLLSGLAGLPFAEDIEDIVDTLAQKLGFKSGSIRFEIAKFIDNIFPGMSPLVLTGFMNAVSPLPGNIGSRTSLGNVFPGTGMFLAGANTSREMMDIAGPAASALTGSIKTLSDAVRIPFSDQISTLSVLREAPITMLRASADAYAYTQTGAIIDRRGYMVSDDMTAGTIAARLLGFYPTAASDQYSMIRIAKRMTDYQRDVTTGFRSAWINAMQAKDTQRAQAIEDAVRDWNDGAKGTALEIRNFRSASMRALREAQRPAGERALKSAPKAARQDLEKLSTLLAY